jgi:hypothetical protein
LLEKLGRLKKFRGFLTDVVKELTLEKVLGESGGLNGYVEDCVEWLERRHLNRNLWRGLPPPSLAHSPRNNGNLLCEVKVAEM